MPSNGMRQAQESATRNGIQALEMAFSGILRCRQDVENTRFNLSSGYQGVDGAKYQELIKNWEEQADLILQNVRDMIDALNTTLAENNRQQGAADDAIQQEFSRNSSVFDVLTHHA
ncbi:hypothetical protein ACWDG1_37895 [Streptomyces sp. NPDC001177]